MSNVERLRGCVTASRGIDCRDPDLLLSSAAEIERLTAENERQFKATTEDQEILAGLLAQNAGLTAENERLRAALTTCLGMVGHPDNIAFIEDALTQQLSMKSEEGR